MLPGPVSSRYAVSSCRMVSSTFICKTEVSATRQGYSTLDEPDCHLLASFFAVTRVGRVGVARSRACREKHPWWRPWSCPGARSRPLRGLLCGSSIRSQAGRSRSRVQSKLLKLDGCGSLDVRHVKQVPNAEASVLASSGLARANNFIILNQHVSTASLFPPSNIPT